MNLDKFKMGHFIVYKNKGSFFGNQIVKAQKSNGFNEKDSQYTHVEPSLGGQYALNARPPRIVSTNVFDTHKDRDVVIVRPNFKSMYDKGLVIKYKSNYQLKRRYKVSTWCATRSNMPYGFFGVVWFKVRSIFKKNIFSALGDFCSEMSGFGIWREYCFANEKLDVKEVLPRYFGELYPADFLNEDYFDIVWEGKIQ